MLQSVLMMGGLGVAIGTALVIASKAFYVYEDPKVVAIDDALPGANCGGCGFPGCMANAEAIARGEQDVNSCVAAGEDVALAIAAIMGVSVSDKEPEFAHPGCYYGNQDADLIYQYKGLQDCRAAAMLMGGMKLCRVGCLGLGTCVTACQFGALSIGEDNLPHVDQEKCTGCGACEAICPKHIIRLTSVSRRIMREYTKNECTTPCQRACPSGLDIKAYVGLTKEGDYAGALGVIKERMPFPTVISRICPALCEFDCRRLLQDEAVAINHLKRFVCDWEMHQEKRVQPYKAPATDKNLAIIGGGVEGLSAAYFSARLGHAPTVFEATEMFGGILRKAIARERLSMDLLEWDIQGVQDLGVVFKPNQKAGKDFTIPDLLRKGYDSVFAATGGWDSRLAMGNAAEAAQVFPGTWLLIDLLRSKTDEKIKVKNGKTVVIVGGGSRLPDAVKILKSNGAETIWVISRKLPEASSFDQAALDNLAEAGATILYNTGITRLSGEEDDLTQIEYIDLDTGVKHVIDTGTLIIGSGRFPELAFVSTGDNEKVNDGTIDADDPTMPLIWEGVELQKKPQANREIGLLSSQDVISEYASAVAAINGGRRAATLMHHLIYGIAMQDPGPMLTPTSVVQDVNALNQVVPSPRNLLKPLTQRPEHRQRFSTGFSEETACKEASRCLRCGLVCYEKV